ncbi:MAG: GNAT family N-acetyltransferase [Anaerolineae bacterium]|nr:GNAT family N-acetyltransferase [Anaerolineae bacterium]
MSVTIRRLLPHESSIYRELRLACLKNAPEHFGSTYEEESRISKLKFEIYIENNSQDHFMFGVFDDEKLIGLAGFDRMGRQRTRHRGEVVHMYVDSNYRGQNIGETLLRGLLEHAFKLDGIEQAQLGVIAGNDRAIKLYEKVGFRAYGIQPKYFKAGDTYMDQQFMQLFKSDYS